MAALLRGGPGLNVVGEAGSEAEALALCARLHPAVVLLDTALLWPAGSARVADFALVSRETRLLALAPHDAAWCTILNPPAAEVLPFATRNGACDCLRIALQEGVHGVLRRSCGRRELLQAIEALSRGRLWIGSEVTLAVPARSPLSDRERAVALQLGRGASNKEIARALGISEQTVKKHVSHILRKLDLQDRLQVGLCVARHPALFAEPPGHTDRPRS
jgi:DNA-binding NarL/FixJ family response regulator